MVMCRPGQGVRRERVIPMTSMNGKAKDWFIPNFRAYVLFIWLGKPGGELGYAPLCISPEGVGRTVKSI